MHAHLMIPEMYAVTAAHSMFVKSNADPGMSDAARKVVREREAFIEARMSDVTERIALESSYNTLSKVQSATLNTLQEAVAVFGLDGKLKLYNAAFAGMWELTPKDLAGEPHIRTIAAVCAEKFGGSDAWQSTIQAVLSGPDSSRISATGENNGPGSSGRTATRAVCPPLRSTRNAVRR